MNIEVFVRLGGSDGLPSGHADFNNGHPGLLEHLAKGIVIVEVFAAPLGPKVVHDEGSQDVQWLPKIGEAANVVSVETEEVIFTLDGGLAK